ncbi:DUF917 domain-containing protein [Halalkalibacterium halodurans]|uniref:DUF917 domain-containing protein n=1 Tax=Halalkalibacterium halodurans TaxID=86665 RepID=A0A0M0KL97_ALKHA|nr:DUF917 domain-containing protein [Halalkalibacterium halodurans]TPE70980.1 DUF917 domain-containing protein [Halalkalibacterium halodurans]
MSWFISRKDIAYISRGAKLLGCGGGGDTKTTQRLLESIMKEDDQINVLQYEDLTEQVVATVCFAGSPILYEEQLPRGDEGQMVFQEYQLKTNKKIDAVISAEIGGMNALIPLVVALQMGCAVVDGDGMGRAFPEFTMTTFYMHGLPISPLILLTRDGKQHLIEGAANDRIVRDNRQLLNMHGGFGHFICCGADANVVKNMMVSGTLKLAYRLGRAMEQDQLSAAAGWTAVEDEWENSIYGKPTLLIKGTVESVVRTFDQEQIVGELTIIGKQRFIGTTLTVSFHNEFIAVKKEGQYLVMVPDLIIIVNAKTFLPYTTNEIQRGMSVLIYAIPAPNVLRQKQMIDHVGPQAYGLDVSYEPFF